MQTKNFSHGLNMSNANFHNNHTMYKSLVLIRNGRRNRRKKGLLVLFDATNHTSFPVFEEALQISS